MSKTWYLYVMYGVITQGWGGWITKIEFWTFGHEDVWVSWVSWVSAWVVDWLARSVMGEGSWRPWPFAIPHCSILVAHPLGLEDETNTGINVELRSLAEKKFLRSMAGLDHYRWHGMRTRQGREGSNSSNCSNCSNCWGQTRIRGGRKGRLYNAVQPSWERGRERHPLVGRFLTPSPPCQQDRQLSIGRRRINFSVQGDRHSKRGILRGGDISNFETFIQI